MSEAVDFFKIFEQRGEKELGVSLKALLTDRGGEFLSGDFTGYCEIHGIERQLTTPHSGANWCHGTQESNCGWDGRFDDEWEKSSYLFVGWGSVHDCIHPQYFFNWCNQGSDSLWSIGQNPMLISYGFSDAWRLCWLALYNGRSLIWSLKNALSLAITVSQKATSCSTLSLKGWWLAGM